MEGAKPPTSSESETLAREALTPEAPARETLTSETSARGKLAPEALRREVLTAETPMRETLTPGMLSLETLTPETPACVYLAERDWRMAHLIRAVGALDVYHSESAFSNIAHSIIEQMMSIKMAARTDANVRALCGGELTHEGVRDLTVEQLRACGMSARKAQSLLHLARNTTEEQLDDLRKLDDSQVREYLCSLPGVGRWTADMFLIFYLLRSDVVPKNDSTFVAAFAWLYGVKPTEEGFTIVCRLWHPYASVAARYLYRAFDMGMPKMGTSQDVLGY